MSINELHASHIGRVAVSFHLSSPTLNPQDVTSALGINPELVSVPPSTHGFWSVTSQDKVQGFVPSKDINEHFRYLLRILLPNRETILRFAKDGETVMPLSE
jgi:hypothetical protein